MEAEFKSYRQVDGFFVDPSLLYEKPLRPGTLLTKVPAVSDLNVRTGLVVGLGDGLVHVLWNAWLPDPGRPAFELRERLGVHDEVRVRRHQKFLKRQERSRKHRESIERTTADDHLLRERSP